jgi:hypothetical protein
MDEAADAGPKRGFEEVECAPDRDLTRTTGAVYHGVRRFQRSSKLGEIHQVARDDLHRQAMYTWWRWQQADSGTDSGET